MKKGEARTAARPEMRRKSERRISVPAPSWPERLHAVLREVGIRQVAYVPDSGHARLIELTRADRVTRNAMADGVEEVVRMLTAHAPEAAQVSSRERALAALALCIGGLTMARALRGTPLSDELLAACVKWALPEPSARPSRKAKS